MPIVGIFILGTALTGSRTRWVSRGMKMYSSNPDGGAGRAAAARATGGSESPSAEVRANRDERSAAAVREERDHAAGGEEPATIPRASSATGKGREAGPVCERSGTKEHRTPGGADEVKRRRTLRGVYRHPGEMMDIARTHFCFNRISSSFFAI